MEKISLTYESGNQFEVYVVRYFKFKNNNYFIYTLGEKDSRNYMKLYVVKIMKELGMPVSQTVRRKDEWNLMKGIIKTALTEIKSGKIKSIMDLNYHDLNGVAIYENQSFQLASDLVDILSAPLVTHVEESNDILNSISSVVENNNANDNRQISSPVPNEVGQNIENTIPLVPDTSPEQSEIEILDDIFVAPNQNETEGNLDAELPLQSNTEIGMESYTDSKEQDINNIDDKKGEDEDIEVLDL